MHDVVIETIHAVRERAHGQLVDLDVTLESGERTLVSLRYDRVPVMIRGLLIGHFDAAKSRSDAGTLDVAEHENSFRLERALVQALADHVGLALAFEAGGVLAARLDAARARDLARMLIDAADRLEEPGQTQH